MKDTFVVVTRIEKGRDQSLWLNPKHFEEDIVLCYHEIIKGLGAIIGLTASI